MVTRKASVLLISLFLLLTTFLLAGERMVVRFENPDQAIVDEFTKNNYDVAAYKPGEFLDIVVNSEMLGEIRGRGFDPIITQTEEQLTSNLQTRAERITGYRSYDDVLTELNLLATEHSDIVRIYDLGDSWAKIYTQEGNDYYQNYQHDIWGIKVTTNPDSLNDKPAIYYMGAHHAREPLSTEVTMDFLNLLLDSYEDDDDIAYLIDNTEIWFLPIVNPDGHKIVMNEVDVWWRKNLRDNNNNGSFDTYNYYGYGLDGVDPNRNYNYEWQGGNENSEPTYPGPYGGSEPEVFAMIELMENHHFVAGISYHTYSELVLWPYGYDYNTVAPDNAALADLGIQMAQSIPNLNSPGHYTPQQSVELYPARGTTDDHAYGIHGIFAYTIELGVEFIPSPPDIQQISDDNMEAAMIMLNRIHNSTLTGNVTDGVSGEPVVAEVFIEGIDDSGSFRHPYLSSENFGRYYRMLLPDEYNVTFHAYGYQDSETYQVTVSPEGQTVLNIEMFQAGISALEGTVVCFSDQSPIQDAIVEILNAPIESVTTNEDGAFLFEEISYGSYQLKIRADNYGTHYQSIVISDPESYLDITLYTAMFSDVFASLTDWETTGQWGLSSEYSYVGEHSLADSPEGDYQSNVESYARLFPSFDLTTAENASVTFMTRYNLESGYDYCYLQISTDNENWVNIETFNGISDWEFHDISLNDYLGEEISFRFLFYSDQSVEEEGIYIDDFRVYAGSPDVSSDQFTLAPVNNFMLYQNYPNPFNPETTIRFNLAEEEQINLSVYNIKGQLVKTLLAEKVPAGNHNVIWNGRNDHHQPVSSGLYFYKLEGSSSAQIKRMLLLK